MEIKHPQYFGQLLINRGFRDWFKYMFYVIERSKFIEEGLHNSLFDQFDKVYNLEDNRININIPPRSGKTTMAKYFLAYCWAVNSKANFIYTSFSQSLLSDISRSLVDVFEHPVYKAMYNLNYQVSDVEDSPVDDFWREYLDKDNKDKKIKYSIRKIVSPQEGVILFSSVGSAITGFGAGQRVDNGKFSGALIIDDANKPGDIESQVMRDKVIGYYEGTLLSRLNNPNVPILNIQQRLHVEDLSAILKEKYGFKSLIRPLIENGVCQLPSQYTEKRLKELQINQYIFESQYQQQPYQKQGNIFKSEWWRYYKSLPVMSWRGIYIDTAQKVKQENDFSVFQLWGKSLQGQAYLIDQWRGKVEAPELLIEARAFWNKCNQDKSSPLRFMKIEDKVSGTGLIQTLQREGIPILGIPRNRDKIMRANDVSPLVQSGNVYLNENASYLSDFLNEAAQFPNSKHDDQLDPMMDALVDILQNNVYNYDDLL